MTLTAVKKDGEIWLKPKNPYWNAPIDPDDPENIYDTVSAMRWAKFEENNPAYRCIGSFEDGQIVDESEVELVENDYDGMYGIRGKYYQVKQPPEPAYSLTQLRSIVDEVLRRAADEFLAGGHYKQSILHTPYDDLL